MKTVSLKNEKGVILVWFLLLSVVLLIISGAVYGLSFQESKLMQIEQYRSQAFYLAETGLDQKLKELRANNISDISSVSFGDGSYSVTYSAANHTVTSVGTFNGISKTVKAVVQKTSPPGVNGALTAAGSVSFNGGIVVDGRDHDINGNVVGSGTYGVSSGGAINQGGSATIGGNGYAPADPANPASILANASSVTTTPEAALGMSPGSLDAYKTSTVPSTPFNGIVYYTGNEWIAPNFGTVDNPSTGILIVHNSTGDALLKNVHGHFQGIIIADDLIHINGDAVITGGLVLQKSTGNTVGNGAAHVNYSSNVLSNLPLNNYSITSWEDMNNTNYTYTP